MNHLEKHGEYDCTSYIEDGFYLDELLFHLTLRCGCTSPASSAVPVCQDLTVNRLVKPIFWKFQCYCKNSISAGCKESVKELDKVWIKAPKDDDKICKDAYDRTKNLASKYGCK